MYRPPGFWSFQQGYWFLFTELRIWGPNTMVPLGSLKKWHFLWIKWSSNPALGGHVYTKILFPMFCHWFFQTIRTRQTFRSKRFEELVNPTFCSTAYFYFQIIQSIIQSSQGTLLKMHIRSCHLTTKDSCMASHLALYNMQNISLWSKIQTFSVLYSFPFCLVIVDYFSPQNMLISSQPQAFTLVVLSA